MAFNANKSNFTYYSIFSRESLLIHFLSSTCDGYILLIHFLRSVEGSLLIHFGGRLGPVVMSLASQVEGQRFELRCDLGRSEAGRLLSIGSSVANVIRAPCLLLPCLQPLHTCKHVGILGSTSLTCRRFPLITPVSSANKTDSHDMT